eukprot:gene6521-10529_t
MSQKLLSVFNGKATPPTKFQFTSYGDWEYHILAGKPDKSIEEFILNTLKDFQITNVHPNDFKTVSFKNWDEFHSRLNVDIEGTKKLLPNWKFMSSYIPVFPKEFIEIIHSGNDKIYACKSVNGYFMIKYATS